RVICVLETAVRLVITAFMRSKTFYTVVDAGFGMIYTTFLVLIARTCKYRIFLHHHAGSYLTSYNSFFRTLAEIAGPSTTHIVGSPWMARDLKNGYPCVEHILISPNACHVETGSPTFRPKSPGHVLTLGFLSNLTLEKGLAKAIDVAVTL